MKRIILALLACLLSFSMTGCNKKDNAINNEEKEENKNLVDNSEETMLDCELLKLENKTQNIIYSPLSIKSCLKLLFDASNGSSKEQIGKYVSNYSPVVFGNDEHKTIGNALFVKDSFAQSINESYVSDVNQKYGAEVIVDSFRSPDVVNTWVNNKTLGRIPHLCDDISSLDFMLVNALGIDMEWNNRFADEYLYHTYSPRHESFYCSVKPITDGFEYLEFEDFGEANGLKFVSVSNKYDIISDLGEDNIRELLYNEYKKWYEENYDLIQSQIEYGGYVNPTADEYDYDTFIDELKSNYGVYDESTDFGFYEDEEVTIFSKELQQYDDLTLEYIAIMPNEVELTSFIDNLDATKLIDLANRADQSSINLFEEGYLTYVHGVVPLFSFDYELKFEDDLKALGITDVFSSNVADLSNLVSTGGSYISEARHKANIEFSNDGIKAGAATEMGGLGAAGNISFDYNFEIPVKELDLTFNRPFMFVVRDKNTQENWFVGTVYQPERFILPR